MDKIIALASDHNGVTQKIGIKKLLQSMGYRTVDLGPFDDAISVDYVDYAYQMGHLVNHEDIDFGILICGTGIGMSIAVNRFEKVRAALVHNVLSAHKSKEHNNSNVLCLGAWLNSGEENQEIVRAWITEKFGEFRHVKRVEKLRQQREESVVFANGIFDILHSGHINLLRFAKSLGNRLVVGINSDRVTRELKGEGRPVNNEVDRKAILQSIKFVDEVLIFDDVKPTDLIQTLLPDIVVKGGEWTAEEVRVRDNIPEEVQVKIFPLVTGYSTTETIRTIKSRENIENKREETCYSTT